MNRVRVENYAAKLWGTDRHRAYEIPMHSPNSPTPWQGELWKPPVLMSDTGRSKHARATTNETVDSPRAAIVLFALCRHSLASPVRQGD